jgi:long-chain acyl-CoA synthetase
MKTLQQLCAAVLETDAGQPAVEFAGRWYDWGLMQRLVQRVRDLLQASGADPAAAVCFAPRNCPSALATLLALMSQGRHVRMLYAFQSAAALARQIEQYQPAVVIAAEREFSAEVNAVLLQQGIAGIALQDLDAHAVSGCGISKRGISAPSAEPGIDILTSGTTGAPKPFPVSYAMIAKFMVGEELHSGARYDASGETPALLYFPFGNITGLRTTVPALLRGQRIVLLERFSLDKWHDFVVRHRPASSGIPPAAMPALLKADYPAEDFASLQSMGSGAAPLDLALHRAFEARYRIPILLSYGATEFLGPVTAMTRELHANWGEAKFGSVGRALPGCKLRVVEPETGASLPAGTRGTLEVVSPRIGAEWIRTSDIAMIDADGFVFLHGRADGAIMRGGFKVLPETIERVLLLHPAIAAASVVGVPDQRVTEVPGAAVQLKPGREQPTVEELTEHLRTQLLATYIPVHWRFVDALPQTPSFKIDRPAVRRLFAGDHGA